MRVKKPGLVIAGAIASAMITALVIAPQAQAAPKAATNKVTNENVIVLFKNQHNELKPQRRGGVSSNRAKVIAANQARVLKKIREAGGTHIKQYNVINAVSATLKSDQIAALQKDSDVAAVVPDLQIARPAVVQNTDTKAAAATGGTTVPYENYCSTDPSAPRLEPEALQTMHVAYDDPSTPSASKLEDGSGVTVGWIADGIDIDQPDFIRANGDHVFVDYQDFSTEGLAAPSSAAEAFGDASSIGAQGRQVYNIDEYTSPTNRLTDGCYVRIQGVAPGANLVGLKVFGNANTAPTSRFIGAIQYAVNVAGVDVLNESFGANPYPDTMDDPISLVNNAAIAAGVTVVVSTGDAGTNSTIGSPASSSGVIAVAATTNFRAAAQLKTDGFTWNGPEFSIDGWTNDNISSLSSGGYAQNGKVPDVSAPGDSAWALCSKNIDVYLDCTNPYRADDDGNAIPVDILLFGGTSQSSPLTAGVAALVIAAYKRAHNGLRPTPAIVKSIITGTAQDLGHPAFEQGAGEVDALRAVQAALSMPAPGSSDSPSTATGTGITVSTPMAGVNQLNLNGPVGSTVSGQVTLTNAGKVTQTLSLSNRALTRVLAKQTGSVTFDASTPTFPNVTGQGRAYRVVNVTVPAGADRLDASLALNTGGAGVPFFALIDPFGVYQAYNSPQGAADYAHIDARYPAPGVWHALIWINPAAFQGEIKYEFISSKYQTVGTVSPSQVTLAPGHSATVTAKFPTGQVPGDASAAVVATSALGTKLDVPVSIRTLIPSRHSKNTFHGVLTGGNGRGGGGQTAQSYTYYFDVPRGKNALSLDLTMADAIGANQILIGFLVGPDGQTLSAHSNIAPTADGGFYLSRAMANFVPNPMSGRWKFIIQLTNPVNGLIDPGAGASINKPFSATLSYTAPKLTVKGLPTARTKLTRGQVYTYNATITNTTNEDQLLTANARLTNQVDYQLASQDCDSSTGTCDDLQNIPLPEYTQSPNWLVPTGTTSVSFYANATLPVELDANYEYGDPEVFGAANGNSSQVTVSAARVAPGPWYANVGQPGPFNGPAPSGTVALNATATTFAFDQNAGALELGDYWYSALQMNNSAAAAVGGDRGAKMLTSHSSHWAKQARVGAHKAAKGKTHGQSRHHQPPPNCGDLGGVLPAGQSCTFTFVIAPDANAQPGSTVTGHLHVESVDLWGGTTLDLASVTYAYKVK